MTRNEAIEELNHVKAWEYDEYGHRQVPRFAIEAIDMAIEAIRREEAEEKGYCHRIKPSNVEVVVRCKDCKHYKIVTDGYGVCLERQIVMTTQRDDDFCSYGERREP